MRFYLFHTCNCLTSGFNIIFSQCSCLCSSLCNFFSAVTQHFTLANSQFPLFFFQSFIKRPPCLGGCLLWVKCAMLSHILELFQKSQIPALQMPYIFYAVF